MKTWISAMAVFFSSLVSAASPDQALLDEIQSALKGTQISAVRESKMPSLYEVIAKGNVFYYHPESKLLFFGAIYTTDGKNLTEQAAALAKIAYLQELDRLGIQLGDASAPNRIIEFTSTDCVHCKEVDALLNSLDVPIKRSVIFTNSGMPDSKQKQTHVLCQPESNRAEAFKKVTQGTQQNYSTCADAEKNLARHYEAAKQMRVNGTPVLFVNNTRVEGANLTKIKSLLIKERSL